MKGLVRRALGPVALALVCACQTSAEPVPPSLALAASSAPAPATAKSAPPSGAPSAAPTGSAASAPPVPTIRLAAGGKRAVRGERGMVSSVEENATRAGVAVLERGGNAVDAAVAVGYALAVTNPQAGPLGGGGFMLVRLASGESFAVDYRETAPVLATRDTLEALKKKGWHGYLSAPVPAVVAGLNLARERFGTLPLAELVAPAVELARGHKLGYRQAEVLGWYWQALAKDPTARAIFGKGNKPLTVGSKLVQKSLAHTLELVAAHGDDGFYRGETADEIEAAMKKSGGLVRKEDLAAYRAVVREPLRFRYRGFEILTMPPPSMGGVALASIMLELEQSRAGEAPAGSALSLHLFAESARRAYADRRAVSGDPAFVDRALVDPLLARLLDPAYHAARTPGPSRERATPSKDVVPIEPGGENAEESPDTTHFSVVDRAGNAVSCTTTLAAAFGAQVVVPGTGVFPSNAIGAFSPSGVNVIAPGKRMASSMAPAIVVAGDKTVALIGSPGGDTIPNTVAQVLRNLIDYGMTIDEAVDAPRLHHQWRPDELRVEAARAPAAAVLAELAKLGHKVVKQPLQGAADEILVDAETGVAWGYADDRQGGLAAGPP
ncbi:MAG: gamma-glutamyltransferase [Polyangiaceae bacterium]|nr:gamma-glutamyltransferase [Polyangiaceae bacterium]